MRAIVLLIALAIGLSLTVVSPFVGVLIWGWLTLQNPHQEAYGVIQSLPLNFVVALVTIGAILLSRERKLPPIKPTSVFMILFLIWITFNSFFAFDPNWSWPFWSRVWKIFLFGLVVATVAHSRTRLYALIWVAVISLFYFGVKGGLFTLATGGSYRVYGPPGTIIGDNNQLALAMLMALPLANYLRTQTRNRFVGAGLLVGSLLTIVAILGSYSRGAFVGMGVLALLMLIRARNRILYIAVVGVVLVFALAFMPASFFERMDTIRSADEDSSFYGRLIAWRVAYMYASDHFPFGAGFYGPQIGEVFKSYFPNEGLHAAHSIYFQVLGEHGYIGLALYLLVIASSLVASVRIIRVARNKPELAWARDMAVALQASLIVFLVSGALLSMAYYDLFIIEVCMLLPLAGLVMPKINRRPPWEAATLQDQGGSPVSSVGDK